MNWCEISPFCLFLCISLTYFLSDISVGTTYTWRSDGRENWPCFSAIPYRIGTPSSSWGRSQQVIPLLFVQSNLAIFYVFLLM